MKITMNELQDLLNDINYLLNRSIDTFKFAKRNGFIYVEYIKTHNTIFDSAITKKELYMSLQAFRKGLFLTIDK